MRYRVLGPVRVEQDGKQLPLGGPQQRLLLALLIAAQGRVVSTAHLIDAIWGDESPPTAKKIIHGYVSKLRSELGGVLKTEGSGYSLDTGGAVDAIEFELLQRRGQEVLDIDPAAAAVSFRSCLALWDGAAYADLTDQLALGPDIARLENARVATLGDRIDADLRCGGHRGLIGELEGLTQEYPLEDRFRAQHMLALYRAGRQVEALRSFERTRRFLADEMGLKPSAELRELERKILSDDQSLSLELSGETTGRSAVRGYELRDAISATETMETYRGYQRSVGREVTVQVLLSSVADDPDFIANFVNDTQRVAALEHPNIGFVYDTWREPGRAYQVSRWFSGGSLFDRMKDGLLRSGTALRVLDQVGGALGYAHRNGVAHGDLSPAVVMFDEEGNAYLRDFVVGNNEALSLEQDRRDFATLAHQLLTNRPPLLEDGSLKPAFEGSEMPASVATVFDVAFAGGGYTRVEDFLRAVHHATGTSAVVEDLVPTDAPTAYRNPYKGLRAFQEADADDFYGRDGLIERLIVRLESNRLVAVIGPSGSGKSSAVKAGLSARIRTRNGGPLRLQTEMFPGAFPFEELEGALLRVGVNRESLIGELLSDDRGLLRILKQILPSDDSELLLVIDQFEELFSMATDHKATQLFLESLLNAVCDPRSRLRVVLTMRADFFDRPLEHPEFGALVEAGLVPVTLPDRDGLAAAIAQPALSVGLELESGLVDRIIHDLDDQPGGLPLLQYAMTELVEHSTGGLLTFAGYESIGGVYGALGGRAEQLYQSLKPAAQRAIRQAFLRMVTVDDSAKDLRRRVTRAELAATDVDDAALVEGLQVFGGHRLLTFDRDPVTRTNTVEVAHEALTREWDRLVGWIHEERDDLVVRRRLDDALTEWRHAEHDPSFLPSGGRLAQFQDWLHGTSLSLTEEERAFLWAASDRQNDAANRAAKRRRFAFAGLAAASIVFAVLASFAFIQKGNADDAAADATANAERADRNAAAAGMNAAEAEANAEDARASAADATASEAVARATAFEAETGRLGASAVTQTESNPVLGVLLAAEMYNRGAAPESLGVLQQTLTATGPLHALFGFGALQVEWAGDRIVTFDARGISVYDDKTLLETLRVDLPVALRPAEFPDFNEAEIDGGQAPFAVDLSGSVAAVGLSEGGVALVDLESGSVTTSGSVALVSALSFSSDSSLLAVGDVGGTVTLFEADEREPVIAIPPVDGARSFADFEQFVGWSGLAPDYEKIAFWVNGVQFSPDGDLIAISQGPQVGVWSVDSGRQVGPATPLMTQDGFPTSAQDITFSGDELWVRTFGTIARIQWASGETLDRIGLGGLETEVTPRGFAMTGPSKGLFVKGNILHEVDLLETTLGDNGVPQATVLSSTRLPISVTEGFATSPNDGRWLVAGNSSVMLGGQAGGPLARAVPTDIVLGVLSIGRKGDLVAATDGSRGEVWDLSNGSARGIEVPTALRDEVMGFEPDEVGGGGSLFVSVLPGGADSLSICTAGGEVCEVYAARSFESTGDRFESQVPSSESPDGRFLASTPASGSPLFIRVVDLESRELIRELPITSPSLTIDWSHDGALLFRTTSAGRVEAWDTAAWTQVDSVGFGEVEGEALVVRHSPDGRFVATIDSNGVTRVRDPKTGDPVSELAGAEGLDVALLNFVQAPWFAQSGELLLTMSDGSVRLWDVESGVQIGDAFPNNVGAIPGGAEGEVLQLATTVENQVLIWNLDTSTWFDVACRTAGRNMTQVEWEQFGPRDTEYQATCPQYPIES